MVQLAIDKFTDFTGALEPGLTIAKTSINKLFDSVVSKVKDLFSGTSMDYSPSGGVEQWRELAKGIADDKAVSEDNLNALLKQMQHESGGNPYAINNWDSNAKKGTPSKGLMQVIDSTFKANALEGYNSNIYDPLSICLHLSVIQYQGMEVCIAVGLQEDTKDIRLVECRSMVRFMWQMKMDSALVYRKHWKSPCGSK